MGSKQTRNKEKQDVKADLQCEMNLLLTLTPHEPHFSHYAPVFIGNEETTGGEPGKAQFAALPHLNLQGNGWFGSTWQPKIWETHHRKRETQAFPARVAVDVHTHTHHADINTCECECRIQ